ncbi:MAG: hypothetical protein AAGF31_08190 [Planctomycetota bacterium]
MASESGIFDWQHIPMQSEADAREYAERHFATGQLPSINEWLQGVVETSDAGNRPEIDEPARRMAKECIDLLHVLETAGPGCCPETVAMIGFRLGMIVAYIQVLPHGPDALTGKKRRAASAKGGKGKATPEQVKELARAIFSECSGPRISEAEAIRRAIAELKKRHGHEISNSTMRRLLRE